MKLCMQWMLLSYLAWVVCLCQYCMLLAALNLDNSRTHSHLMSFVIWRVEHLLYEWTPVIGLIFFFFLFSQFTSRLWCFMRFFFFIYAVLFEQFFWFNFFFVSFRNRLCARMSPRERRIGRAINSLWHFLAGRFVVNAQTTAWNKSLFGLYVLFCSGID